MSFKVQKISTFEYLKANPRLTFSEDSAHPISRLPNLYPHCHVGLDCSKAYSLSPAVSKWFSPQTFNTTSLLPLILKGFDKSPQLNIK